MEKVNKADDISRNFQNATNVLKENSDKYEAQSTLYVPTNANTKSKKNSEAELSLKSSTDQEKGYSDNNNSTVIMNDLKNLAKINFFKTSKTSQDYRNMTSAGGVEKYTNNQVSNQLDYNQYDLSAGNETMYEKEENKFSKREEDKESIYNIIAEGRSFIPWFLY